MDDSATKQDSGAQDDKGVSASSPSPSTSSSGRLARLAAAGDSTDDGSRKSSFSMPGTPSGHSVTLNIDYRIIEHFSDHLYASENKALEELVSNGFDALATRVYVYTPGKHLTNRVVVWDDGQSMSIKGLQDLWVIADSPKQGHRVVERELSDKKLRRTTIGKFGIGKLASYVVGERIIHLCKANDGFYAVGVDYEDIRGAEGGRRPTLGRPLEEPIYQLHEDEARGYIKQLFDGEEEPTAIGELFDAQSWTVAVIEKLKKPQKLKPGRLTWVLGNGLPLRDDFAIWVNDSEVESTLETKSEKSWSFDDRELESQLKKNWNEARESTDQEKQVEGELIFDSEAGLDPNAGAGVATPYVKLPGLGKVWGRTRIFEDSLLKGRHTEQARSHGFFVYVLGRLINASDPQFHHHAPQFGTFNRCQIVLHVDGLDDEILADRKSVQEGTPAFRELKLLLRSTYQVARTKLGKIDDERAEGGDPLSLLPTRSPEYYRRPLLALLDRAGEPGEPYDSPPFNLDDPDIRRSSLGEDDPVARIADDRTGFEVNTSHPFYQRIAAALEGNSKNAKLFRRWYDLFAISDLLFIGQLHDLGVSESIVRKVAAWRNTLLGTMAQRHEVAPSKLTKDLENTSYGPDGEFEAALAAILRGMGFSARRIGGSGREDVLLEATFGPDSYKLVFDAKSSKGSVAADKCDPTSITGFRKDVGADHAVFVARQFEGFKTDGTPKILEKCKEAANTSLMTTACLTELFTIIEQHNYPLDVLRDIFFALEPPDDKLRRIRELDEPTKGFDWRTLIRNIETQQIKWKHGQPIPITSLRMDYGWEDMNPDEFAQRVAALAHLGEPLVRRSDDGHYIHLRQSANRVIEHIQMKLSAKKSDP